MDNQLITSRIIKTALVKWEQLQFIQQENFKEWFADGDTKLTESILKYQFIDPFKVWEHDGNIYCLDGKHRFLDLLRVRELGSGTALIACEHTKRKGRFTEIEPMYVQSDIVRYVNYCKRNGIDVNFTHLNGSLTLNDFTHDSKLSNAN